LKSPYEPVVGSDQLSQLARFLAHHSGKCDRFGENIRLS